MGIDRSHIGRVLPTTTLLVSRSRLRNFAKAIGQENPIYVDVDAARQAGHRDLPVPPTFFFAVELEAPDPFAIYAELGVQLSDMLHGEQSFEYERMAYAGDELSSSGKISDIYAKKGGLLEFIVSDRTVVNQNGEIVARSRNTAIAQHRAEDGR
ncbi:MAG TPA: MaoC family dehydratase N-terminal domain-containing protein [Mycobacterium sp.]